MKRLVLLVFLQFSVLFCFQHNHDPNVTVVFVVDQLSYDLLKEQRSQLRYGLKELFSKGICYHNATYPHAIPTTPTGHACIATGAFANAHGICSYGWLDDAGNYVLSVQDDPAVAAVFAKVGEHGYGRSAKNLMCDTLADQFCLTSRPDNLAVSAAFSLKSRASIMMAGHSGKAFWFDDKDGCLTTSKAYFPERPRWLEKFNHKNAITDGKVFRWKPFYCVRSKKYHQPESKNYQHAGVSSDFNKGRKFTVDCNAKAPFDEFKRSPFASHMLVNAAKSFMRKNSDKRQLIYLSFSNFDISGHLLGPDNREQVDLLYYLDFQIGKTMSFVRNVFGSKKVLFALTSDHGCPSIPEVAAEKGFSLAERIDATALVGRLNNDIEKEFGYKKVIKCLQVPQIFLDPQVTEVLSQGQKKALLARLKKVLLQEPAIKNCWTRGELEEVGGSIGSDKYLFAKQTFLGRAADLTFLVHPYKMVTEYATGTSHTTPYRYDVHVPLCFLQKLRLSKKDNQDAVSMLDFSSTLATLMGVAMPSASNGHCLPLS